MSTEPSFTELPPAPRNPTDDTPTRRHGSVRRTSHINMVWPEGRTGLQLLRGAARDFLTRSDGSTRTLATARIDIRVGWDRVVREARVEPHDSRAAGLAGARGGGQFRAAIRDTLPGEREAGTPLYFLLDDVAGATLIGGFAWSLWPSELEEQTLQALREAARHRKMASICKGFRPNGWAMTRHEQGHHMDHNLVPAVDHSGDDPLGWHEIEPPPASACMRRRRRIDVWKEHGVLQIDATFRDSMWKPDRTEIVVHEYCVRAAADLASGELTKITAEPRVLPFIDCPLAAPNAAWMVGKPLRDFRESVLETLTSTDCCTHLNDTLRGFGEIPVLAASVP